MVFRVTKAFWLESAGAADSWPGVRERPVQPSDAAGRHGLILTTLILTAPPMAAVFFQGTLGTFMAYSQIGGGAAATPSSDGRPPGQHTPEQTTNSGSTAGGASGNAANYTVMSKQNQDAPSQGSGKYGNANVG